MTIYDTYASLTKRISELKDKVRIGKEVDELMTLMETRDGIVRKHELHTGLEMADACNDLLRGFIK